MVLLPHFPRSVSYVRLHMSRIYRLLIVQLFTDLYIPCSWYANVATIFAPYLLRLLEVRLFS